MTQAQTQRLQILAALEQRSAERRANCGEDRSGEERTSAFLTSLMSVFGSESRLELSSLVKSTASAYCLEDLRPLTEEFLSKGARIVEEVPAALLVKLGRQIYSPDAADDGDQTSMGIFKSVSDTTTKDYARRLACFLRFCLKIEADGNLRRSCGIKLGRQALTKIREFRRGFEQDPSNKDTVITFLLSLSSQTYRLLENYNADLMCSYAIGQLFDCHTGKFNSKESSNKSLSAFKYSLRMAILHTLQQTGSDDEDALVRRVQWHRLGENNTFKSLTLLQAGVNSLPRKLKPAAMVTDSSCEQISYDGIPCSFDMLNEVLHSTRAKAVKLLGELLMGFSPTSAEETVFGFSALPFTPHFALGEPASNEFGNLSLFDHVMSTDELRRRFYGTRRRYAIRRPAQKFLKACKEYEKLLVVMMHILVGCGVRATDYKYLTFRNGAVESEARTVSIYDADHLHCTMYNSKCSTLHGKNESFSTLLPRKFADPLFIPYWKYVRPFAVVLKEGTKSIQSFERWQRFCFVQACDEKVGPKSCLRCIEGKFDSTDLSMAETFGKFLVQHVR